MGTSMRNPGQILALRSAIVAATPEGSLVVASTSATGTVVLPSGASPTTMLMGLLYQASHPTLANQPVEVVTSGVFPGIAGAGITAGDLLTSNGTDGTVKAVGAAGGTNEGVIGQALESASTGERVAILINPFIRQG